jgi:hypothetical protein
MRFILLLAAALFLSLPAHADQFADGKAAYEHKDYKNAMVLLRPLADQGNAEAQETIGEMYGWGLGVQRDEATARKWYLNAAEQGEQRSLMKLGLLYLKDKDWPQAYYWFSIAGTYNYGFFIASYLTAEQKAAADNKVREWRAKYGEPTLTPEAKLFEKDAFAPMNAPQIGGQKDYGVIGLYLEIPTDRVVNQVADGFTVRDVIGGSPAERAGIKIGDKIIAVNGMATKAMPSNALDETLDGRPGEEVTFTIIRSGGGEPLQFHLLRVKECLRGNHADCFPATDVIHGTIAPHLKPAPPSEPKIRASKEQFRTFLQKLNSANNRRLRPHMRRRHHESVFYRQANIWIDWYSPATTPKK